MSTVYVGVYLEVDHVIDNKHTTRVCSKDDTHPIGRNVSGWKPTFCQECGSVIEDKSYTTTSYLSWHDAADSFDLDDDAFIDAVDDPDQVAIWISNGDNLCSSEYADQIPITAELISAEYQRFLTKHIKTLEALEANNISFEFRFGTVVY